MEECVKSTPCHEERSWRVSQRALPCFLVQALSLWAHPEVSLEQQLTVTADTPVWAGEVPTGLESLT